MCDPAHDKQAVVHAKYEIGALALAGFIMVNSGQFRVSSLPKRASSVLPYLPMPEALDSKVDLIIFSDLVPIDELTVISHYYSYNAMRLADLLRQ